MSRLQKKPSAHKRGHPTLQNMNFFYFCGSFLPSWIRIRIRIQIMDPDPNPMVWLNIEYGSNPNPDPNTLLRRKTWSKKRPASTAWTKIWTPTSSSLEKISRKCKFCPKLCPKLNPSTGHCRNCTSSAIWWRIKEVTTPIKITGAISCSTSTCWPTSACSATKFPSNTSQTHSNSKLWWPSCTSRQSKRTFSSSPSSDWSITPSSKCQITRKSTASPKWRSGTGSETSIFPKPKRPFPKISKRPWPSSTTTSEESTNCHSNARNRPKTVPRTSPNR